MGRWVPLCCSIKDPKIRWPNTVIVKDHKISGVLINIEALTNGPLALIGIGINVSMSQEECQKIDQPVTSLFCELANKASSIEDVLSTLTQSLHQRLCVTDLKKSFKDYDKALAYKEEVVKFIAGEEEYKKGLIYEKKFKGITSKGHLILDSFLEPFSNGEIAPKELSE